MLFSDLHFFTCSSVVASYSLCVKKDSVFAPSHALVRPFRKLPLGEAFVKTLCWNSNWWRTSWAQSAIVGPISADCCIWLDSQIVRESWLFLLLFQDDGGHCAPGNLQCSVNGFGVFSRSVSWYSPVSELWFCWPDACSNQLNTSEVQPWHRNISKMIRRNEAKVRMLGQNAIFKFFFLIRFVPVLECTLMVNDEYFHFLF